MIEVPSRRLLIAGLLLVPTARAFAAPAALSPDDQALVDKAVAYLQGLNRAQGRFTQTGPRGRRSTGRVYLERPGKIRFEYDPPNDNVLVISDGEQVNVSDSRAKTSSTYPLRATPLALFLAKEIRLDKGVRVTKVDRGDGQFAITAKDGGHDTAGQIVITFSNDPVSLLEWTTTDAQGQITRIQLTDFKSTGALSPDLFHFAKPRSVGKIP